MVAFATLSDDDADVRIAEQVEHFRALGQAFEWKVYAFDRPCDLRARLGNHGFIADDEETLMTFTLHASARRASTMPTGCTMRRIVDATGVDDIVALQERVWQRDFAWLGKQLVDRLAAEPETLSVYGVYRDAHAIGSGWTDFPVGSRFPELHGGAVLKDERGRGLYRALLDVRAAEAVERGHDALCVDASSMSRPILEGLGFVAICATVPMRMRFDAQR